MKIKLYKSPDWIGLYQIVGIFQKFGVSEDTCHDIAEKIDKKYPFINDFLNKVHNKRGRKDKIKIEYFDTWSAAHTLAKIIVPVLKQLKKVKHGAPAYDIEDVPEKFKLPENLDRYNNPKFFEGWDWIMEEMIYGFSFILEESEKPEEDFNILEQKSERAYNGRRLFAKYYQALWD